MKKNIYLALYLFVCAILVLIVDTIVIEINMASGMYSVEGDAIFSVIYSVLTMLGVVFGISVLGVLWPGRSLASLYIKSIIVAGATLAGLYAAYDCWMPGHYVISAMFAIYAVVCTALIWFIRKDTVLAADAPV